MKAIKALFMWIGLLSVVGLMLGVIFIGGWHAYHYEIAPRVGLHSDRQTWEQNIQVATSAFRLLDEKNRALDRLLQMRDYAQSLSEPARQELADRMYDVIFMEDYPLDLKFKGAKVRAMLVGEKEPRQLPVTDVRGMDETAPDIEADITRLESMLELDRDALRRTSPSRTQVFVTHLRRDPCHVQLVQLLERFIAREDLPPVERSFLFGMQNQVQQKCS